MEIRIATEVSGVQERVNVQEHTDDKKSPGNGMTPAELQQESNYSKAEISKEIASLNKWLESKESHLQFVLHAKLNEYYVQVVNNDTNEVMKEIPSKKVMDLVANLYEKLGFIVDKKI